MILMFLLAAGLLGAVAGRSAVPPPAWAIATDRNRARTLSQRRRLAAECPAGTFPYSAGTRCCSVQRDAEGSPLDYMSRDCETGADGEDKSVLCPHGTCEQENCGYVDSSVDSSAVIPKRPDCCDETTCRCGGSVGCSPMYELKNTDGQNSYCTPCEPGESQNYDAALLVQAGISLDTVNFVCVPDQVPLLTCRDETGSVSDPTSSECTCGTTTCSGVDRF